MRKERSIFFFYEYDNEGYLKTITIDQVRYVVELDDMSVSKLLDEMGNVIVVYQYENGLLNGVFGVNSDGELIDRSDDKEFVGNWNRITYKSYYFDEETGWYYRGKYYDAKARRFVDGRNNVATENGLDREPQASILSATTSTVEAYATKLYDETMADSSHGIPLDYSAYWYMGLSDIELLTRMIYGENTWLAIDQKAITWVTWNRMTSGENTAAVSRIREVVAANNQFASITGGEQHSDQARNPDVSGLGWYNATRLACQVYAVAYYGNNLSELIDKPLGINTQTQFRSYNSVFTNGSMKVDSDGTIYMEFLGSQTGETIRYDVVDIAIPGSGNFDTLSELQMAYLEDYSPGDINIYFNLE